MNDKDIQELKGKLTRTRQTLLEFLGGLTDEQWQTAVFAEDSEWSLADLLRHLASAEHSMTRLMGNIRDGGEGAAADFDLSRWNASRVNKTKAKTPEILIAEIANNRTALVQFIDALSPEDWGKEGRHGSLRIMSIAQICHLIADHETTHTADMRRAMESI